MKTLERIGILGAGQLALMLTEASRGLELEVVCAGSVGDCAALVATVLAVDLEDAAAVRAFAAGCSVVTVESENLEPAVLEDLPLAPNAQAIRTAQDRLLEKRFLNECGAETAPFAPVGSLEELQEALAELGMPAILKTRRMGYDGKGQVRIYDASEAAAAWAEIGEAPAILEGMVTFEAEISLVAVRSGEGELAVYPLTENRHREGILRRSDAPSRFPELQGEAERLVGGLLERFEYVGVLAVEFFVADGRLIANEMAPRVHNSGHWTIEGSESSQFENHLRAIAGLPLGSTQSEPMVMLNCIGEMPLESETAAYPGCFRHDYGKEPRPGRKVGHLTFRAADREAIAFWDRRLNPGEFA